MIGIWQCYLATQIEHVELVSTLTISVLDILKVMKV